MQVLDVASRIRFLYIDMWLQVLDVACNKLLSVSASQLASGTQLECLDMQMTQFALNTAEMDRARYSDCYWKPVVVST